MLDAVSSPAEANADAAGAAAGTARELHVQRVSGDVRGAAARATADPARRVRISAYSEAVWTMSGPRSGSEKDEEQSFFFESLTGCWFQ